MPSDKEVIRFGYQLNIRDVSVEGDCLKLDFQRGNFFETIKAKLKNVDGTIRFKRILWEGIDCLTIGEIRNYLKNKLFSAYTHSNAEGEITLKIVFPPPLLSDFFSDENTPNYPFIPGFIRMKEYLNKTLETSSEFKDLFSWKLSASFPWRIFFIKHTKRKH